MERENNTKVYVSVIAKFDKEGNRLPIVIYWEDGRKYKVDKVLEIKNAASLKAGGAGIRYLCEIAGKRSYIFLENERKWFVERKGIN